MDIEMTAVYADSFSGYPPAVKKAFSAAFEVDPATIVATVLVLDSLNAHPVAQAGLRPHSVGGTLEVKKVIVDLAYRGRGISRALMFELETVARGLGTLSLVLQTGDRQPAAIALYESMGYRLIPSYPPFELMANALCYEKVLTPL